MSEVSAPASKVASTTFEDPGDSISQVPSPTTSVAPSSFRGRDATQKTTLGSGGTSSNTSPHPLSLSVHITPASPVKKPASMAQRTTSEVSDRQL